MVHDTDSLARKGEDQYRITIAFLVLSWFFIFLRVFTRTFIIYNLGWDDFTMVLAGMVYTIYCSGLFFICAHGGGTHITSVAKMQLLIKWTIASQASYLAAIMVLKISLAILFVRIAVKKWQLRVIYVTVGVSIISCLAAFFFVLLRCGPDLDNYIHHQLAGQCTPKPLDRFMAYQQAVFTTLTDFVFATMPIPILWNASIDRRSKISVGFILSLAALGCICSLVRFQYIEGLVNYNDFFWSAVNISLWSCIEPGAGIIAGCLATLRPLLKRVSKTTHTFRPVRSHASTSPNSSANKNSIFGNLSTFRDSKVGLPVQTECHVMHELPREPKQDIIVDVDVDRIDRRKDSTEDILEHLRDLERNSPPQLLHSPRMRMGVAFDDIRSSQSQRSETTYVCDSPRPCQNFMPLSPRIPISPREEEKSDFWTGPWV